MITEKIWCPNNMLNIPHNDIFFGVFAKNLVCTQQTLYKSVHIAHKGETQITPLPAEPEEKPRLISSQPTTQFGPFFARVSILETINHVVGTYVMLGYLLLTSVAWQLSAWLSQEVQIIVSGLSVVHGTRHNESQGAGLMYPCYCWVLLLELQCHLYSQKFTTI